MITIIYDGDCPLCQDYVRRLRLVEVAGGVELVDARTAHPDVLTAWQNGYDLDRGMLAVIGGKALVQEPAAYQALIAARKIALFAAAPFIGLVYAMLMPFFGLAMIAKIGYQAYKAPRQVA